MMWLMNLLWVVDLVVGCHVLMLGIIPALVGSVLFRVLMFLQGAESFRLLVLMKMFFPHHHSLV